MSLASDDFAACIPQAAMPEFYFDAALVDAVWSEIASPQAGAPGRSRHPRRRWIVDAIAASNPPDAMQAVLVARIISARRLDGAFEAVRSEHIQRENGR
jgi:hypothetical protein